MIRLQVKLSESDFRELRRLAEAEYRAPQQQAGILIREALGTRGLIQHNNSELPDSPNIQEASDDRSAKS
jgi:hypothetical protein